jgi:hypothetical protein
MLQMQQVRGEMCDRYSLAGTIPDTWTANHDALPTWDTLQIGIMEHVRPRSGTICTGVRGR